MMYFIRTMALSLSFAAICTTSCNKDPEINPETQAPSITFTSNIAIGKNIGLGIIADQADQKDCWIDLNGNGKKEEGEKITTFSGDFEYTLGAQTITIYGKITTFVCRGREITALDVSKNRFLKILICSENQLELLDLSNNTELTELWSGNNKLSSIDISNCAELNALSVFNNGISAIELSKNPKLRILSCDNNKIKRAEMAVLIEGLPVCPAEEPEGDFIVFNSIADPADGNECTEQNVIDAKNKRWKVKQHTENGTRDYSGMKI